MTLCINPQCSSPQNPDNVIFCQACSSEILLEGRYRAVRSIGSGGFGRTFEVKEGNSSKVLKVLSNNAPKAVELFQREAEVLSQLSHPGIPKVESNGYFAFYPKDSQIPVHCLVMEKIDGDNLRNYIKGRGRPLDGGLAVRWLNELALILQQVHARDILHRDIKPENIIVKPDGKLALIDFGAVREGTGTEVATQAVKGSTGTEVATHMGGRGTSIFTAGYAAPEQIEGFALPQSDFYSLGRTFIFLLTAKEPNDKAMYDAYNDTIRWQEYSTGVSPRLAHLIDRMVARLARDRPASAEVILQELNTDQRDDVAPSPRLGKHESASVEKATVPHTEQLQEQSWVCVRVIDKLHRDYICSVAFSPDGQILASSSEDGVALCNWKTGAQIHFLKHPRIVTNYVRSIAFNPNGKILASGSNDKLIRLWDWKTGKEIDTIKDVHSKEVTSITFSPDGRFLASGSDDRSVSVLDLENKSVLRHTNHKDFVQSVAFSSNGQALASAGCDKAIYVYPDAFSGGGQVFKLEGHRTCVTCVNFSPDGKTLASGSRDGAVKLWNLKTGQMIHSLPGHSSSLLLGVVVVFSPNGQTIASAGADKTIKIWQVNTGDLLCTLLGHSKHVTSIAFSPDGQTIASGSSDKTVRIWRTSLLF